MRPTLTLILIASVLWSCNRPTKQAEKQAIPSTNDTPKTIDLSRYHTTHDTVIVPVHDWSYKYSRSAFNTIIDNHPEFFWDIPGDPDHLQNSNDDFQFTSEQGRDEYMVLYAYFLKQQNGENQYSAERQKLIDIYLNINSLFGSFQYGGTYFGHQHQRLLGFAEYSIYILSRIKDRREKTYDITKQKRLYIQSLRQLVADEVSIDQNTWTKNAKRESLAELNKIVDELDRLITDVFYLRRAQEFHYSHYEYY